MNSTGIEKIIKKAYKLAEIDDEDYCVHTLSYPNFYKIQTFLIKAL